MNLKLLAGILIAFTGCGKSNPIIALNGAEPSTPAIPDTSAITSTSTCVSDDPEHQCIGLKLVSYQDANGVPTLNEFDADHLVDGINDAWKPCNIAFQLEKYESVNPTSLGLTYSPNWKTDSTSIRAQFSDPTRFVVVAVGPWTNATIAVTQMPGNGPFGTLVSLKYAKNPLTVGHELGHYQGLYHLRNSKNLMNPYIGPNTLALSPKQCSIARNTNTKNWTQSLRRPASL